MKYHTLAIYLSICALAIPHMLFAQLTGGNYEIYGDTFSFVSVGETSGGTYTLFSTGGEFFASSTTGGDYTLRGGFLAVEKGILSVSVTTSSISLGQLSTSSVASQNMEVLVSTDNFRGYTLSVYENQNPTNASSDTIDDVGDGSVTAGSEEYGIAVSGADAIVGGGDVAVTTSTFAIAQSDGEVTNRATTITYKMAISPATPDGLYSHVLRYRVLVNL